MKFAFIRDHRQQFPVDLLCATLDVSRSGFYAWCGRPTGRAAERRAGLVERIRAVHRQSRSVYGSPRVTRELQAQGQACCENTVAKLMRVHEIRPRARRAFRVRTTDSRHDAPVAANLLDRGFYPETPDTAWAADLTYVPTAEGWLYLAVVLDLFSRKVIGWATADHLRAELPLEALRMALTHRRPAGPVLHHSDRGSQYASAAYRSLLERHGIESSMSRPGNCWDNAVVESFFSSLKRELVHHEHYADRASAQQSLFEYIEVFYNRSRRHSTLGYRSPAEFETRFR